MMVILPWGNYTCGILLSCRHFGGIYCLHLQERNV